MRKSGERGEVIGDLRSGVDNELTVDDRLLRPTEGLSTCTRVALPIFAVIVPLFEMILFGRLSSSIGVPNVDVDLEEPGRMRLGSVNGLPSVLVSVSSSTSSALNAIWASGDRIVAA